MSSSGKELISTRRRGGDGKREIEVVMEYGSPNDPTVEKFNDSSVPAVVRRHETPRSALSDFLPIKAELQRQTSLLIDREYDSVVLRVFVQLVCTGARSMDMDRAIKRRAHDIFSRFCVPKEKLDEMVDDGIDDFDRAVSMFARQICVPLQKLAALLSNEGREAQYKQVLQLSMIADVIHGLWATLRMPHMDEFLKPESQYIDLVFPRVVVRWGCRSALIVYSRIKKELQRQVGELIDREDNSNELRFFNYYGVCLAESMEYAIRTSATEIFTSYFGRIPQWYKKKEAERSDEMKDETDDETDDEIEDFNLNVSLFCEDICRQVEELLGLVSVDKTSHIQQLIRIAHHINDFKRNLAKVGWMPVEEEKEEIVAEGMEIEGEAEEKEIVAEEEEIVAEGMEIEGEVVVSGTIVTMTKVRSLEEKHEEDMSSVKKHEEEENEEESERAGEEMSSVKRRRSSRRGQGRSSSGGDRGEGAAGDVRPGGSQGGQNLHRDRGGALA